MSPDSLIFWGESGFTKKEDSLILQRKNSRQNVQSHKKVDSRNPSTKEFPFDVKDDMKDISLLYRDLLKSFIGCVTHPLRPEVSQAT